MATRRKSSAKKSGGVSLFGVLVGVVLGLVAAVAVALFVTQAPMPFVDRASRTPDKALLPDIRQAPDPNAALAARGDAPPPAIPSIGDTVPGSAPATPGTAAPGVTGSAGDDIGKLIASLDIVAEPAPVPAPPRPAVPPRTPTPAPGAQTASYYLQAGAFRSDKDADSMQARVLMLGLPVVLQKADVNGVTLTRVRVGPFKGIDDMNRARERLGQEKIESTVVKL